MGDERELMGIRPCRGADEEYASEGDYANEESTALLGEMRRHVPTAPWDPLPPLIVPSADGGQSSSSISGGLCLASERGDVASNSRAVEDRPPLPVPKHMFSMKPSMARALMAEENAALNRGLEAEYGRPRDVQASGVATRMHSMDVDGDDAVDECHRLVLDPCLGRMELLIAKGSLGAVLAFGVLAAGLAACIGSRWLEDHVLKKQADYSSEVMIVCGFLLPALLGMFLLVLEHSEWAYLRKVSPSTPLKYTPLLHKLSAKIKSYSGQASDFARS